MLNLKIYSFVKIFCARVVNGGLFYLKHNECFLNAYFENLLICKNISAKDFAPGTNGSQESLETLRWPCKTIILSFGHFEGPTDVLLNRW